MMAAVWLDWLEGGRAERKIVYRLGREYLYRVPRDGGRG